MKRRVVDEPSDLRSAREARAEPLIAWFRTPGHDSYWRYHRDQFLCSRRRRAGARSTSAAAKDDCRAI